MLALAAPLAAPPAAATAANVAADGPRVTIAILPRGETAAAMATASPGISPGLMSAGLGSVPADQTYLDIGQGNRLFDSLYPRPIPPLPIRGDRVGRRAWRQQLGRAAGAPAQIEPGLLADRLLAAGIPIAAKRSAGPAALIAVHPDGTIDRASGCRLGGCPGVTVGRVDDSRLRSLLNGLGDDDLLIAVERPPPLGRLLAVGIAGGGFRGNLSSPTTRIDGYVLSTDLAPTILAHYGLEVPGAMSGRVIGSTGSLDVAHLRALQDRLGAVAPRRHPVLGVNLLIWLGIAGLLALLRGGAVAAWAVSAVAVAFAWVPALLLLTAALEPGVLAERLLVGIGAPLLALLSIRALWPRFRERAGFAAFALAALVSVVATAVDVVAGSSLTALSLIGPNPELGVRFFGIGNELEAVIGALLALGSGAAVFALGPRDPRRAVAATAGAAALVATLVFAPGRWGADVGAAITFPAGAAGVVVAALGGGRRRILLAVAAPVLAVAALVAIDLAIGGDAHLSRSVLDAGGLDQLGQVVERRVRLGARSFQRFGDSFFFGAALVVILVGLLSRRRVLGWFERSPAARAGLAGGVTAAVVGALANDSGSLLLMVGTAYVAGYAGLGWAAGALAPRSVSDPR